MSNVIIPKTPKLPYSGRIRLQETRTHEGRLKFFDWIASECRIRTQNDWYKISRKHLKSKGALDIIGKYYSNSFAFALQKLYPQYIWHPWLLGKIPDGYWDQIEHRRQWIDWLGEQLNIQDYEDWYNIEVKHVHGKGRVCLHYYGKSLSKALQNVYPEYDWLPWRFSKVPTGYWNNNENIKKCLEWLAAKLDIKTLDDWYKMRYQDVTDNGGHSLLMQFNGSLYKALQTAYPHHTWHPWIFTNVPKGFWDSLDNHKAYIEWLGKELGFKKMEDYYQLKLKDFDERYGSGITTKYGDSIYKILSAVYPDYPWKFWKFQSISKQHWNEKHELRKYLDWLGDQVGVTEPNHWYKIRISDLQGIEHTTHVLNMYGSSIYKMVKDVYPDYPWQFWMFVTVDPEEWDKPENQRQYFDHLENHFDVKTPMDWWRITSVEVRGVRGGTAALERFGSLSKMLSTFYSSYSWTTQAYSSKIQAQLFKVATEMFPDAEVLQQHKHKDMVFSGTKNHMELDVFVPSYSIAFELQGPQHFASAQGQSLNYYGNNDIYMVRDVEKREVCQRLGITLIEVPYWWDRTKASIVATLHQLRPDLVPDPGDGQPIPSSPPPKKGKKEKVED